MPTYLYRAYNKLSFLAFRSNTLALIDPNLLSLILIISSNKNNNILIKPL